MYSSYPHLLQPFTIGNITFRNRIFSAPVSPHSLQASEPYPTEPVITHLANKARGGAACVTCVGVNVFPSDPNTLQIASWDVYHQPNVHYLGHLSERIHAYGAKASMEIGVVGVAHGEYAVSDGARMITGQLGREMPFSEMERYADGYAFAAEMVKKAGFDMILLHFGHGLTLGQFLSPLTNKRTDRYNGSPENRARFPRMIINRIRERVGRNLLIEVRISGCEFTPGGIVVEEAIEFVKLVQDSIDLIQVSAGKHDPEGMTIAHPTSFLPPTPNVFLAEAVKKAGVKIPVVAIGGIQDLACAEKIIAHGRADVVTIARGFIADPDLGEKAYSGRGEDVTPCIKCMRCHDSAVNEHRFICTVNPLIGLEHQRHELIRPPEIKRKVAVVGGGPAGMKAALVAAERGHEVILFEKSGSLGGLLKTADTVPFKYDLTRFKQFLIAQVAKANISVRLNIEATPEMLDQENAEVILAALGAEPIIPPIRGVTGNNVMTALKVYGREEKLGKRIVIIGGGQVGCETALLIARLDRSVTILEILPEVVPDMTQTLRTELLLKLKAEKNIQVLTQSCCTAIAQTEVCFTDNNGQPATLPADHVILAVGMKSQLQKAEAFRGIAGRFVAIGDCRKVGTVEHAINSAFYTAIQI